MSYRFHVVGLPHTQTVKAFSNCAFTDNVRKFCMLLKELGHHVTLYASEDNDAPCDEFVTCITKEEQKYTCGVEGPETVLNASYQGNAPHWMLFNGRVTEEIKRRVQPKDFLGIIAGSLSDSIIQASPQTIAIEYAVGYTGISQHTYRAFASSTWQHCVYGKFFGAHGTPGRFYDRVIPHFLDPHDFIYSDDKDDYFLFVGRCNMDKGVGVAADVCRYLGKRLVVAGQGPFIPEGVEYVGLIGPKKRAQLMSRAKAVFVPSLYLEPFGMVAIEALMSGTPIITTDWGGLREINEDGITGYRCYTLKDFVQATKNVLDGCIFSRDCRERALEHYSIEAVMPKYEKWFFDLYGLWRGGWSALPVKTEANAPPSDMPHPTV